MAKLGDLFSRQEVESPEWDETKSSVIESIDLLMDKGTVDKEVLLIMKELLGGTKPSMSTFIED